MQAFFQLLPIIIRAIALVKFFRYFLCAGIMEFKQFRNLILPVLPVQGEGRAIMDFYGAAFAGFPQLLEKYANAPFRFTGIHWAAQFHPFFPMLLVYL